MASQQPASKRIQSSKRTSRSSTPRATKKVTKAPPPRQQKTKSKNLAPSKQKQRRTYTDEELGIPRLNMITPVGVQKPRGKKKGKVFVDDAETMQTILAMVNAEQEGHIESKMMRARQMEEIREARRNEAEAKEEQRKHVLETKKDELRKRRKKAVLPPQVLVEPKLRNTKPTKKVSFS